VFLKEGKKKDGKIFQFYKISMESLGWEAMSCVFEEQKVRV